MEISLMFGATFSFGHNILFVYCEIQFAEILFRYFMYVFMWELVYSFPFLNVFVWFRYQDNIGLRINWEIFPFLQFFGNVSVEFLFLLCSVR